MSKKILFLILGFIAIVIIFMVFWIYRGTMFSKEILRLEILGSEKAVVGQEIEYTIKYKNNGNFALEQPKLVFNMPDNSLTEDGKTMIIQDLDDIYPGAEEFVKIKTRLLGKEGDLKVAKATLSYIPKNLTARYESDTTFTTTIDQVPITLDFDLPSKAEKGKPLQYSINYFSNVDYPLENISLKLEPLQGFNIDSSTPVSLDNLEWKLPTLNKAQGGRVNILGRVTGDADQNLEFKASLGVWRAGDFVAIKEADMQVEIIQPLLYISQQVNGSSDYVASPGESLHYQIFFRNIGTSPFENLFMIVKLEGAALDTSSIQTQYGQVQPNDNMIVWSWQQTPQLRNIAVQQESMVDFTVQVRSDWSPSNTNGTTIIDDVNISQISQKFIIKVNSGLVISQKALFQDYNFENTGPTPPEINKTTTYTVTWDIQNYFSDAKNVKVKAKLPVNVTLTGKIAPQNEASNFSFDSASREIVWSAGDILAGTGVNGDPVTLSFQIFLTPMPSQVGSVALLIESVQISGENQFTNTTITAQDSGVDTTLPDDSLNSGGGIVQ